MSEVRQHNLSPNGKKTRGKRPDRWQSVRERLEAKHVKNAITGCWEYTGYRQPRGYGSIQVQGKAVLAHRASYEEYVGPIPEGMVIDHLCRNTSCINPEHLEPTTQRENLMRSPFGKAVTNSAKTHCPQGHEYTPENTRMMPQRYGWARVCGTCHSRPGLKTLAEIEAQEAAS